MGQTSLTRCGTDMCYTGNWGEPQLLYIDLHHETLYTSPSI